MVSVPLCEASIVGASNKSTAVMVRLFSQYINILNILSVLAYYVSFTCGKAVRNQEEAWLLVLVLWRGV